MGTYFLAPAQNHLQKTLSGGISDSVTTITLNNTTSLLAPGYIVIDRENSAGTATPNSREVVYYTGISGSDLTGCVRGADGSTNRTHNDGAIVETFPSVGMWNNLVTISSTAFDSNGYLKAIASPVSIARMQIIQESITSIASIARAEIGTLQTASVAIPSIASIAQIQATRAFLSAITVATSINVSGASIVGITLGSTTGALTRDLTVASGDVSYTGVGFIPSSIVFMSDLATKKSSSYAVTDAAKGGQGTYFTDVPQSGVLTDLSATCCIFGQSSSNNYQIAIVKTYDADGFTLTWTKTNTPTGTLKVSYIAYK